MNDSVYHEHQNIGHEIDERAIVQDDDLSACLRVIVLGRRLRALQWALGDDVTKAVVVEGENTYPHTTAAIAATHTVFNITNTVIFLPFVPFFERLVGDLRRPRAPAE